MTFVTSAWTLTIFFILLSAVCFYLSYKTPKTKRRMIEGKEILFLAGLSYLLLAHFAMFVSIGQSLDENYQAPCEWLQNNSTATTISNVTNTTYEYIDSCATRETPASASALVVVFTWLLFCLFFAIMMAVIYQLTRFVRDFF